MIVIIVVFGQLHSGGHSGFSQLQINLDELVVVLVAVLEVVDNVLIGHLHSGGHSGFSQSQTISVAVEILVVVLVVVVVIGEVIV